ncbi:MAG: ABC transporter permease [Acidilobaceae archaeon]|nr:ABC transporter permease [Acidilobaceae archaeon]MCX8165857.1 ABC transporter permease [Acidilobaceae archaeon]MDW7974865.1 ABC transporter permease [Sulfolobales archaeon]
MGKAKEYSGALLPPLRALYFLAALLLLVVLWEAAASLYQRPYLPHVWEIGERLWRELSAGELVGDLQLSLRRIALSLLISSLTGITFGLLAARSSYGSRLLRPIILATYPMPHITLIPILLWLLGVEGSKIAVISLITFYPIALSTMEWALRTPREYEQLIETMGGNAWHKTVYVVIPSILPGVLTGLRLAVSTAFAVVFVAESFVLTGGVGAFIEESWQRFDYAGVYAGMIALSAAGMISYAAIWLLEKRYREKIGY